MQLMLINDKKIQRASLLLLGLFWSVAGFAQTGKQDSLHSLQDKRVMNQEQYTANPATLVQSHLPQYGFAGMHAGFSSGDYRRPMQAENIQSFMGETGGHRILKGWTYNGYFSYGKRYDRSVAWSRAMDPYEGNPSFGLIAALVIGNAMRSGQILPSLPRRFGNSDLDWLSTTQLVLGPEITIHDLSFVTAMWPYVPACSIRSAGIAK